MQLTIENYYSQDANRHFMSVSQYKSFIECEAKAMAELNGTYEREMTDAFLIGQYVHAWSEGTLDKFKKEHEDKLFDKRKKNEKVLLSKFQQADKIIETIKNDKNMMLALQGQKEVIFTAELFGVPWKIRIDNYNPNAGYYSDLKIVSSLHDKFYNPKRQIWENFVEHYKYDLQMVIYATVEKIVTGREDYLEPYLVVATKETPSDKVILKGFLADIQYLLWEVEENLPRIIALKEGKEEPKGCGKCDYCRSIKTAQIMDYHYLLE